MTEAQAPAMYPTSDRACCYFAAHRGEDGIPIAISSHALDKTYIRMKKAGVDVPLVVVEGIIGLAASDPEWDGQETFHCQDPDCPDPVRSVDEVCYLNIWKRSRRLMN
jgi:hypothetical protein